MPKHDAILSAAEAIAGNPEWWRRLQAAHQRDEHGDCAACRWEQAPRPRWPCGLYAIGAEAEKIHRARAGGHPAPSGIARPAASAALSDRHGQAIT